MHGPLIDYLSTIDPASKVIRVTTGKALELSKSGPIMQQPCERFLSRYGRLEFGWYIAGQLAHHRMQCPAMLGRDYWVFRAYLMRLDPHRYFDKNVAEAYHMSNYVRGNPDFGKTLRAMLLSVRPDVSAVEHIAQMAEDTGIDVNTIEAFEVLFYNVLDRRDEGLYLATHVYPDTRAVEFDEGYLSNTTQSKILERVGYNHRDLELTKYLAGIGDQSFLKHIAASDNREADLTKFIMGNGLLLTHTNLLNQRSVGMSRASTLLAAARQGGNAGEEPAMSGIAPLFNEQYKLATQYSQQGVRQQLIKDSGQVVEV